MKHVVLFSGGMDSATALTMAQQSPLSEEVVALSIHYGSRHNDAEFEASRKVCSYLGINRVEVALPPDLFHGAGSALMGDSDVPNEEYHDPEKESPSATVVPFRNANLISVATAFAESRGFDRVWVAVHASDATGFAYPDCTPQFMGPMAAAVYIGTHRKVSLMVPFQWMTKAEIVAKAAKIGAPLQYTWSCYRGRVLHCAACPTCLERIKAFQQAGYIDPVSYDAHIQWPKGLKEWPA